MSENVSEAPQVDVQETGVSSGGLSDIALEILAEDSGQSGSVSQKQDAKSSKHRDESGRFKGKESQNSGPPEGPDPDDEDDFDPIAQSEDEEEAPQEFELKVKGKVIKAKSIDELKSMAQRGLAMQQNYETFKRDVDARVSELNKRMEAIQAKEAELSNPAAYLKKLKKEEAAKVAEELLLEQAQEWEAMQNMSPREKELYLKNKEYQEKLKATEEAEAKQRESQEMELVKQQEDHIGAIFSQALEKHGVPKSNIAVKVMANIYRANLQKGVELSPEQAAQLTRQQLRHLVQHTYGGMSAEEFVELNPKLADAIRQHYLTKAKGKPRTPEVSSVPLKKGKPAPRRDPDEMADEEWEKTIKKLKAEGSAMRVKNGWG